MAVDNGQGKGKFVTSNSYVKIKGKKVKQWITVNGRHIPIYEGEKMEDAILERYYTKEEKAEHEEHNKKTVERKKKENQLIEEIKNKDYIDKGYSKVKKNKQIDDDFNKKEKQIKQNEGDRQKREAVRTAGKAVQKQLKKEFHEQDKRVAKGITPKIQNDIKKLADKVLKEEMGVQKSRALVKELWEKSNTNLSLMDFASAYDKEVNKRLYPNENWDF